MVITIYANIYPISPIDADIGGTIRFNWSGNQAFKNRCIIKDNDSSEIVYDYTIETFKFEHQIQLDQVNLVNGKKYNAFITVIDKAGMESDLQPLGTLFHCLSTPSFQFSNVTDGQIISSSSYEFFLDYNQAENELLDSWSIALYYYSQLQVATSGTKYDTEKLSYLFAGFDNKKEYYIRGTGKTVNGIPLDTGLIKISVTYEVRELFSLLEPTNLPDIGAVQIRSNIVSAEGHLEKQGTYINGEYIDLRDNTLTYSEGFVLNGDFSFVTFFYGMEPNQEIVRYTGDNLILKITYRVSKFNTSELQGCFELRVESSGITYTLFSNPLELPLDNSLIGLCLVRQNGYYNIETIKLKEVEA